MKNGNMPAMPMFNKHGFATQDNFIDLTKREAIEMHLMAGLLANSIAGPHHQPKIAAKTAVLCADALIAEWEKRDENNLG